MTDELFANIDRFETAAGDLRALISEAHSTIKDLRVATGELAKLQGTLVENAQRAVEQRIVDVVQHRLDAMGPALEKHMDRSVQHINGEFKKLERALFRGRDGVDLRDVAETMSTTGVNPLNWSPPLPSAKGKKNRRRS